MEAIIKLLFTLWIISMIVEFIFAVKFLHSRTHVAFYSGSYMEMQHDKWFQILRDALAMVVLPNMILFFVVQWIAAKVVQAVIFLSGILASFFSILGTLVFVFGGIIMVIYALKPRTKVPDELKRRLDASRNAAEPEAEATADNTASQEDASQAAPQEDSQPEGAPQEQPDGEAAKDEPAEPLPELTPAMNNELKYHRWGKVTVAGLFLMVISFGCSRVHDGLSPEPAVSVPQSTSSYSVAYADTSSYANASSYAEGSVFSGYWYDPNDNVQLCFDYSNLYVTVPGSESSHIYQFSDEADNDILLVSAFGDDTPTQYSYSVENATLLLESVTWEDPFDLNGIYDCVDR